MRRAAKRPQNPSSSAMTSNISTIFEGVIFATTAL